MEHVGLCSEFHCRAISSTIVLLNPSIAERDSDRSGAVVGAVAGSNFHWPKRVYSMPSVASIWSVKIVRTYCRVDAVGAGVGADRVQDRIARVADR